MKKLDKILVFIIVIVLIFSMTIGVLHYFHSTPSVVSTDTVTVTKIDTLWRDTVLRDTVFKPKYVKILKRDTVYSSQGDTIELVKRQETYQKSFTSAKDTAEVEIYVSGIETSLDSLNLRLKTHSEVVTNTVEVTKYMEKPKKMFTVQPQATFGYDPLRKEWGVLIGLGVGFNW